MKKRIILTGPQGGGKSYTIARILANTNDFICVDGIGSIEEFDNVLLSNQYESNTLVMATNNLDEETLRSVTKNMDIQVFLCDYKRGIVPSVYKIIKG